MMLGDPGATHFAPLSACPWLSYFAPSVLPFRTSVLPLAIIFRTFGAFVLALAIIFRTFGAAHRCWLSYFAPSVLPISHLGAAPGYHISHLRCLRQCPLDSIFRTSGA